MAVRPWENRFLDINLRDGVMVNEDGPVEGRNGPKSQIKLTGKKPILSNVYSNVSSQKTGPSQSDGSTSPGVSASIVESSTTQIAKPKSKPPLENLVEEAPSRPFGISARSQSNPKERSTQSNKAAKKRHSLPNSGISLSLSLLYICMHRCVCFCVCLSIYFSSKYPVTP